MPHLKELVELHQDDPFALIGLNNGDSKRTYRKGLEQHGITWLNVYQGAADALTKMYRVRGFPTLVLIDHEGKIVSRSARGSELDHLVKQEIERAQEAAK